MQETDLRELKLQYVIVGRDEKLDRALNTALQVARTNLSVLIQGESGTGKEVIPKVIHNNSLRKRKPYIAINCGSIPEGTIDSELFGHIKGSFTGAIADHPGYFGAADGGTLFLDEVGELPLSTQVRLLRVLETGEYVPVGSSQPRKTDVRIVAATNVQMEKAIREGTFREDLYYRLCTIRIQMPALRERGEDMILLFKKFAMDIAREYQIPEPIRLTMDAEQVVMAYRWPGNIRQLKNVVEQMSFMCENRSITPEVLAEYQIYPSSDSTDIIAPKGAIHNEDAKDLKQTVEIMKYAIASLKQDVEMLKRKMGMHEGQVRQLEAPITAAETQEVRIERPAMHPVHAHRLDEGEDVEATEDLNIADMEKRMIERALRKHRNRRKNAAAELGLSERTLYRKIKDYGLEE